MPEGIVIQAIGGFFDVVAGGVRRRCRARGVFKKRKITILVGDHVRFDEIGSQEGVVTEVLPRHNQIVRPPMANVDHVVLVFAMKTPDLNVHLLDRTLAMVESVGVEPTLVLTKTDLVKDEEVAEIRAVYERVGVRVLPVSVHLDSQIPAVRDALSGKTSVFAGPSGAGKSTLANALLPELGLRMGEVSEKLGLGRHTTRHIELFQVDEATWVADAPGFSQMELEISSSELRHCFREFRTFSTDCAYRGCLHVGEVECGVKEAVERRDIALSRYESYVSLFREVMEREEHMY